MAISRSQLVKELEPGLNALFGMEYDSYQNEHAEIYSVESSDRAFEEEPRLLLQDRKGDNERHSLRGVHRRADLLVLRRGTDAPSGPAVPGEVCQEQGDREDTGAEQREEVLLQGVLQAAGRFRRQRVRDIAPFPQGGRP